MKMSAKFFLIVVVLMMLVSAVFAGPMKDTTHVTVSPTHFKNLLILKADKQYMGATVEVHDANGALITSAELNKRKMIIDFYDIPYGAYTICVVKDKTVKEFKYTKIQDSVILN
jgi:hypothetical protein